MIKEIVRPTTNFNMMMSKVGDVLARALDKPLGYAINWGRV
jgi:NADH-quinone oxidoreductase subunit B